MCGILGVINIDGTKVSKPDIEILNHRGPDDHGEWVNQKRNVFLGHTRLAILEPSAAGHQPMKNRTEELTLVYNGEIYNHLELRSLLPDITWNGNSDTETLIELLAQKGIETLSLLNGMFAFACYNETENSVLLVRDRLGIKPLYVHISKESISFASEIKALKKEVDICFDSRAISEYIGFGHFPSEGPILNKISSIPPGSWMKIKEGGQIETGKWWSLDRKNSFHQTSKSSEAQSLNQLVSKVINDHLISDVGVASFLSGGIDSSIISIVAGKTLGKNLKTFTVGFPDEENDERDIARTVADLIKSDHTEVNVSEDECLIWVKQAVNSLDLPSIDAINTYIVSRAVRNSNIKVALSGLGGDELFGGYPSFNRIPLFQFLENIPGFLRSRIIRGMPFKFREKFLHLNTFSATDLAVNYRRFTSVEELKKMQFFSGTPNIPYHSSLDEMGMISKAEIYGYTIPMLLRDSDQMSMAVGLEIRVPFLDHRLVERILHLPEKFKKGRSIKPLLLEAFKESLPKKVYSRPKQGFALPLDTWIKGPLAEFTYEGIAMASEFLKLSQPLDQMQKFNKGELHWTRIWHWSVMGHWLKNQGVIFGKSLVTY